MPRQRVVIPFRISTDALARKLPYKPSEIVREALIMQFNFNNERHRSVTARKTSRNLPDLSAPAKGKRSKNLLFNIPLPSRVSYHSWTLPRLASVIKSNVTDSGGESLAVVQKEKKKHPSSLRTKTKMCTLIKMIGKRDDFLKYILEYRLILSISNRKNVRYFKQRDLFKRVPLSPIDKMVSFESKMTRSVISK